MKKNNSLLNSLWLVIFLSVSVQTAIGQTSEPGWGQMDAILQQIVAPVFKDKVYNITKFGAIADGKTDCTMALKNAIEKCSKKGGGTVLVPKGVYLTGALHMLSNVNLHLEEGAILKFSTDPNDYLPLVLSRWEGVDCYNYSPLIYAYKQKNIAITGKGKLDGQANEENWWIWKGRKEYGWEKGMESQSNPEDRPKLIWYNKNETPVDQRQFGEGNFLRPPFIQFNSCENILIEDITIENAPFWIIHPLLSENIIVRRVTANSTGPNNDGCDPESCKNVLIEECFFNTGDDCIAIKSGRDEDGRRWNVPSENIIVRNCEMRNGHGGVVIGSEISGGCKNVFVENCTMNSPELDRAIRIKTNTERGGIVENIFVRNIKVGEVKEAVVKINCLYDSENVESDKFLPVIRNVHISNIKSKKSKYPLYLQGIENEDCVYNIYIDNSKFDGSSDDNFVSGVRNLNLDNVFINGNFIANKKVSENCIND
ncbi:MAG: glycoside hydrolase family 28 protein [Bacteroidales bacterium]|nr:glycoside hydrolase family 28 protein [Bacteroidales bacterium]